MAWQNYCLLSFCSINPLTHVFLIAMIDRCTSKCMLSWLLSYIYPAITCLPLPRIILVFFFSCFLSRKKSNQQWTSQTSWIGSITFRDRCILFPNSRHIYSSSIQLEKCHCLGWWRDPEIGMSLYFWLKYCTGFGQSIVIFLKTAKSKMLIELTGIIRCCRWSLNWENTLWHVIRNSGMLLD